MNEMENTADLITEGDTVAVVAADENDDNFLLKVTRTPYTLRAEGTDDCGNTFPKGARVVGGYYYKSTESAFKIVRGKKPLCIRWRFVTFWTRKTKTEVKA
ncbi:hypothetical protein DPMN_179485 [Dreissena polymorpha]|uniref:Uncharacterized protein n=1 Tax=Dreissena polymorpha TaxID=45954 RepID=A0A9D4ECV9_DREPO|nr:hypothetical protein DPMN_179485 [Dreissena polymorpha]